MARPRKIASPTEFIRRADAYFKECDESQIAPSVTGLTLALGLSSRSSLDDYERRSTYTDAVRWARLKVEHGYETGLRDRDQARGCMFALERMLGWRSESKTILGSDPDEPVKVQHSHGLDPEIQAMIDYAKKAGGQEHDGDED